MTKIERFSRIDDVAGFAGSSVAFGGATPASVKAWLKSEGFATVINLRLESEEGVDVEKARAAAQAAGLKYYHLPFNPTAAGPALVELVQEFLSIVTSKDNQPVYIHCRSATRVAALWILGRVLKDGWTIDKACKEAETIADKPAEAEAFARAYIKLVGL